MLTFSSLPALLPLCCACPREGTAGGQSAKGLVHIPYLADENAGDVGESLEVRVSAEGDGPADRACREAAKQALPLLRSRVAIWVAEMAAGGPGGAGPAAGDGAAAPAAAAAGADDGEPAKAKPGAAAAAAAAPAAEDERRAGGGGQTVRLTERYFCRPADVFEALTSESRVRAYAGGDAAVSPLPGAPFSLFGGGVSGVNLAGMAAGARVEQRWRARDWPDGVFSHVLITLSEPEHGTTVLQLVQTGVPAENRFGHPTETAQGWKQARARLRRSAAGSERRPAAKAAATGDRQ